MAKKSLAKAYVQIVPSAEGIQGSISKVLNGESNNAGKQSGSLIGSTIKKMIISAGIGTALKETIMQGADLQQSLGGIDTLFKDSAGKMKEYAAKAYKTAGASANSYMKQATSFSASLIKSLGGDTAKAVEVTNMAIVDMADNTNKMGTDIESIQNAYQGFAKQNYTMLDNLKLGYGGTKTEMERLIADANRVKAANGEMANLSIDSFANVTEAIHIMQVQLGIAGATSQEASSTISGSFASMKAAAQNFLGNLALGENIVPSLKELVSTTNTFLFDNLLPAVCNVVFALPEAIGTVIIESSPILLDKGKQLIETIISGIKNEFPKILENGTLMINEFITGMLNNGPSLLSAVGNLMLRLIESILASMPKVLDCGYSILTNIASGIINNLPKILEVGISLIGKLAAGIVEAIPDLLKKVGTIYTDLKNKFDALDWKEIGKNIISGIVKGVTNAASSLVQAAKDAASSALNGVKKFLGIKSPSRVFQAEVGEMIPAGAAKGILANLNPIHDAMKTLSNETLGILDDDYTVTRKIVLDTDKSSSNDSIDYEMFAEVLVRSLKYLKIELDSEEVGSFVDERLLEVL